MHPTAIVAEGAVVPDSCTIGPFCTIGPHVVLGERCVLVSHVVLDGHLTVGDNNRFSPFAAIGVPPQDLKYKGEPTRLTLGDNNDIREYVTISRGTPGGGGHTRIGSHCLIMAYVHIGHDSVLGDHCILANAATLAGHVTVEDYVTIGALCPVHQFCHIGRYAYVGGGTTITRDVLPFSLTVEKREARAFSINKIGLARRGFSPARLRTLQNAFRTLLLSKTNTTQAVQQLRAQQLQHPTQSEDLEYLFQFIERSERGVVK